MRAKQEKESRKRRVKETVRERATGSETDRKREGSIVAQQMQCLIDRDCLCAQSSDSGGLKVGCGMIGKRHKRAVCFLSEQTAGEEEEGAAVQQRI